MPYTRKRRTRAEEILRFCLSTLGVAALVFLTVISVRAAWGMYGKMADASIAEEGSERELAALETQKAAVTASLEELSTARGQEAALRERYGVARPGEGVMQIVAGSASSSADDAAASGNWFTDLFRALFLW